MANHNQLKRISVNPQANTIPYANESGFITAWLDNDPLILSLKQENEYIGSVPTAPEPDTQSILTQFVYDTVGRAPRNGDQVAIEDVGELWMFNGSAWAFFTNTTLKNATTTSKGVMQVGAGLNVNNGIVSVDDTRLTMARVLTNIDSTTPSIAVAANTDYVCLNPITSLTLSSVADSQYYSSITFTTSSTFTFTASTLTQYYFSSNPPTFESNTTYKLVIVGGKCHIYYIGSRVYPINKIVSVSPALTPSSNIATWTITNTLATGDVFVRVYESSTGNTVEVDSTVTASTITLKLYSESASISAGVYTAVILG